MANRYSYLLYFLFGFLMLQNIQAQQSRRMYFVGNSVTDAMNYGGLKSIAESRGNIHTWARLMIPGSPLELLWEARTSGGFTEQPYGNPVNAFAVYQWDIISLQPFDRPIEGPNGDRAMISNFYNLVKGKSPDCKVFIYAHWPRVPYGTDYTAATKDQYNTAWLSANGIETRKFNEDLTTAVRADFPATRDNFVMVPIGEVFYSLNNNQAFLDAAGIRSIWGVYSDGIHMKGFGSYIAACTMYAMAYHQDPVNLGVPGTFGSIPEAALPYIHQAVKEVIIAKSVFTNINYFGAAPLSAVTLNASVMELNVGKTAVLVPLFTPSNAADKSISWSTSNDMVAVVNNGVVTALKAGTASIKVISADGGLMDSCLVNVTDSGVAVTGIQLNKSETSLQVGEQEQLTAVIEPSDASNKSTLWSSSDVKIVTVDQVGKIAAINKGTATITATTVNSLLTASVAVTVTRPNNPPVAVLNYSPGNFGYAPFKVTFNGRSSYDPDPDDFVLGYDWVIKKQGETTNYLEESSNGFDHTFTSEGVYDVTLQAVDNGAQLRSSNTEKLTVTVLKMPDVPAEETAICYEGFDYVKAAITNFNGGRGWRTGWSVQSETSNTINDFAVSNIQPIVIGNLQQAGNYMILGQGYSGVGRQLDISDNGAFKDFISGGKIGKAGTTLWFSVAIRPMNNNKECYISLSDENIAWLNNTAKSHLLSIGSFGGSNWGFAFGHENSRVIFPGTIPVANNTPAFLVAKIEFGTPNTVSLYVNPTPGTEPDVSPVVGSGSGNLSFQSISMNFSNGSLRMAADEIRFGNSYADVAPKKTSINTGYDSNHETAEVSVYPNPSANHLNISGIEDSFDFRITNLSGQQLLHGEKYVKHRAIDISQIEPGIYFIQITNEKQIRTVSFIKK